MVASFTQRPTGTEIAKHAWNSTVAGMRAMPALFLAAFFVAILLALGLIRLGLGQPIDPGEPYPLLLRFLVALANIVAWSALGAPLAVAMHRFILLGRTTTSVLSYVPAYTRMFFLWLLALQLVVGAINGVSGLLSSRSWSLIHIMAFIAVMVLSTNMAMIFPAIATETPSRNLEARIAESWRQMRGNFWLFVRASIVTFLPALILWVVIAIVMMIFALMVRGVIGHGLPLFPRLVLSGAIGVTVVLSIALAAALASWTYVWVRSDDQAQSAQTATSTVT